MSNTLTVESIERAALELEPEAEDEATPGEPSQTVMEIPSDLVPAVRELIARRGKVA